VAWLIPAASTQTLDCWLSNYSLDKIMGETSFMRKGLSLVLLLGTFVISYGVGTGQSLGDKGQSLNEPPPGEVRALVKRGVELAEEDRLDEAVATLKKAVALSPSYLRAHIEYRNIKQNFLGQFDEVETEYDTLLKREPDNPVYLMALYYLSSGDFGRASLEKVAHIAPEWAWGHYAKALLLREKEPEKAADELLKCIQKDPSASEAYYLLIELQTKLKRIDDAIATAERFAAQPDLHANGLLVLWRLRLVKANQSEEAKEALRSELRQLAAANPDIGVLGSIRSAYSDLLNDREMARRIEDEMRKVDPAWYPMRGWRFTKVILNESAVPRYVVLANRQLVIYNKTRELAKNSDPQEKIRELEVLLSQNPSPALKRLIYEDIFHISVKANDIRATLKYGEALHEIDPSDTGVFVKMAMVLANNRADLNKALQYARNAEAATAEFRPIQRPANTPKNIFERHFSAQMQREAYEENRASALDALGWVLYRRGNYKQAESALRRTVNTKRSATRLSHLVAVLRKLGRKNEADRLAAEADKELVALVRRNLVNEPVKDLQLEPLDGSRQTLSALQGKVVLINFWATWCGPCREELPDLVRLYEKYKGKGFEVIAISTDKDRQNVLPFVRRFKPTFPVFYDTGLQDYFNANAIPTNIFIDRVGKMRYRKVGFDAEDMREIEAVVNELIK
jgi:thiol-disulfide isomerase/thioredoxin